MLQAIVKTVGCGYESTHEHTISVTSQDQQAIESAGFGAFQQELLCDCHFIQQDNCCGGEEFTKEQQGM